jgi:predicted nuclease with TOPRIM domain
MEELTMIRRHLSEGQSIVRETVDRLRMSQEENEHLTRRRDELEGRVVALEAEYEELLGPSFLPASLTVNSTVRVPRKNDSRRGDERSRHCRVNDGTSGM